jgi:pimeloyl-ACP methyl ester carboxylesterase
VRERAIHFGGGGALSAIITEPPPEARNPSAPGVVLSNVGMHSRIGPYRMWVELARKLAAAGYLVLRFDQAGFGDSEAQPSSEPGVRGAAQEQTAAIDALQSRGASGVVLIGFCSGVDPVHVASLMDDRVVGVVHIDGYAYPTLPFLLRRWTLRMLRFSTWRDALRRRIARLRALSSKAPPATPAVFDRVYPPPFDLAAELRKLAARGVRMMFLWTRGREHEFNHAGQFYGMLKAHDLRGKVEVRVLEGCDHLFSSSSQRALLFDELSRWIGSAFAGQKPAA